ncbi:ABC transporter substrate-binding protein [Humitalea sp. 24SJ18S-53]|uniref:ABC transporter substrate-binding protein n=1 Tax=Humitalea sp. 24SJ18S-53 TaxID=3422307 RepID=UPI003D675408
MPRRAPWFIVALLCAFSPIHQSVAQQLNLALASTPTSVDPHFHNLVSNNAIAAHVFDKLVHQDERQRLTPGLAESWTALSDTEWEFRLRPGVTFHDGSPLEAEDVAATLRRIPNVPNSPGPFTQFTRGIAAVEVVDPHTLRLRTRGPQPLLPTDLSVVNIIPRRFETATTADFRSGAAMIGTGPFRFESFTPGERVVLTRNDAYWGGAPAWARVTLRIVPNDSARAAALLAGDVDAVEAVPLTQIDALKRRPDLQLWRAVSNRVMFLSFDTARDVTPFATARDGRPLPANPLRDLRVRRALSLAINRPLIVDRLMEGEAIAAGGLLAEGFFGASPRLVPPAFDPDTARRLLREAGYADGFRLTIHGPNDRFPNDDKILQAVAQMLTRIGIDARAEAMPFNLILSQGGAPTYAFSTMLLGWGSNTGEASSPLRALLATIDRDRGLGVGNRGRYSNPALDAVIIQALGTVDDAARRALLERASEIAMEDQALVPILYQVNIWATRRGLAYTPRADEWTLARFFTPVP